MLTITFLSLLLYLLSLWKRPLLVAGLVSQTVYLVYRGITLGRLPLVGTHDTTSFLSASLVIFSIPFYKHLREHRAFFHIIAAAASVFTFLSLISKQHNMPLPPVLKTFWFELHVTLAFFSYALFAIGAVLGYLFIARGEYRLEGLQYKSILTGYLFFSASMIFGGIWAYLAWGTYWLWTPKELWTSILWLFYSLYLHARLRPWWTGKPCAILGITGFGITLFTYLGVSLLMKSSHAF